MLERGSESAEQANVEVQEQAKASTLQPQLNKNAKEFQPMGSVAPVQSVTRLNAEAPEFVPEKSKLSSSFSAALARPVTAGSDCVALSETQNNIIKLIRTSGPNGLLVDEIPEKYKEKYCAAMGEYDLSMVLDSIQQYVHVMLAPKVDALRKNQSLEKESKFSLGHHKGKRVVDQFIYTMGEGVEEFREMIVKVIREFCVRNMTRSDHPLTLATKGLLPAGANGVVRPTGLALSLFAAEWDRYFSSTEDLKSLREKYNVQKLMPFLLAIPELDIVGTHPEVRVRMKNMGDCLEEAERRAQTCSPEEISAMQSGGSSALVADKGEGMTGESVVQSRKVSLEVSPDPRGGLDRRISEFQPSLPMMGDPSLHLLHQQQAAMAAHAAHYHTMGRSGFSQEGNPAAASQAHVYAAAMKFQYHHQMMQAAAASISHSHAVGGPSIPITSEFFPTASSDSYAATAGLFGNRSRKLKDETPHFPPLPPTNSSAYNPLAAKMQLMKSVNVSRGLSSSVASKVGSPAIGGLQPLNQAKSMCVTPHALGGSLTDQVEKSLENSAPGSAVNSAANSATKGSFMGRASVKSGGLKLTPVASEAPIALSPHPSPAPGLSVDRSDLEVAASQLADLAKLGIGLFDSKRSGTSSSGTDLFRSLPLVGQGGPEDTTASATPVPGSVNASSSDPRLSSAAKLSPNKPLDGSLFGKKGEQPCGPLFPFVEPLNPEEQSASNYLQEMLKIMKEPLGEGQASDSNLLTDIAHVLGNSSSFLGTHSQAAPLDPVVPAETEVDPDAATKILMSMLQQAQPQVPKQAVEPFPPFSVGRDPQDLTMFDMLGQSDEPIPESLVSSFFGQLMGEAASTSQRFTAGGEEPVSLSPELKFDEEAVDKLTEDPKAPPALPAKASNGEYDRLTMLLMRAQMKHQMQEAPPELKTLKTAYDPEYLKMKRPAVKPANSLEP